MSSVVAWTTKRNELLGAIKEQDVYVRLIDSQTKQVRKRMIV